MSGLREYLKAKGAKTLTEENCPALAEYQRAMREEVIPAIERDLKAQRRAAHFLRLGIPDPAIAIEAQRAVTVKQGAVRSTKARVRRTSPNSQPMNTPTHEGDVE
jgi:hypothetical protein